MTLAPAAVRSITPTPTEAPYTSPVNSVTFYIPPSTLPAGSNAQYFFAKGGNSQSSEKYIQGTYTVSDPSILEVSYDGNIIAKAPGTASITLTVAKRTKTIDITVTNSCWYAAESGDTAGLSAGELTALGLAKSFVSANIPDTMSDYEKVKAVHDFIVLTTEYDVAALTSGSISERSYSIEGVMIDHLAVCQGYTDTFQMFMNLLGIRCSSVSGYGNGTSHIWNMVWLDGNPYHIDVTFDDPIFSTPNPDYIGYSYFLVPESFLADSHSFVVTDYEYCTATYYTYYRYQDGLLSSFDEFEEAFKRLYAIDSTSVTLLYPETVVPTSNLVLRCNDNHGYSMILAADGVSLPRFGDYSICQIIMQ